MTRRIIALKGRDGYYISQEFNGDRDEAMQLRGFAVVQANWSDIVPLFNGVSGLSMFSSAVKKAENLFGYENLPLEVVSELPSEEEIWIVDREELVLFSKYGEVVDQNG